MDGLASRVLIVDDNPQIRKIAATILRPMVGHVLDCADPQEALDVWRDWRPELVLVDFEMRPITGAEFTRKVRAAERRGGPRSAIVMMTAHSDRRRVLEAREAGVDDLVAKPLTLDALIFRTQRALERAHADAGRSRATGTADGVMRL